MNLAEIQTVLAERGLDGWLFADFRGSDVLAYRILGLSTEKFRSRRWFYFIPRTGDPMALVHAIEQSSLDGLPGSKQIYLGWPRLRELIASMLAGSRRIAMQFSPLNNIPYVARVDAGSIDLVRSFGIEVESSADLIQLFEARLTDEQIESHHTAAVLLESIVKDSLAEIGRGLRSGRKFTEFEMQQHVLFQFAKNGLETDHGPIVAIDDHAADPHFENNSHETRTFAPGQTVLLDAWCKQSKPASIYADITWVGYIGNDPPADYRKVFDVVTGARDAAVTAIERAKKLGEPIRGCDADDACRTVIDQAGFGEYFIHRTGHSIGEMTHGNGANIDNLETHDTRPLIPRTVFSIEPGVYLPGRFGIRSEINVLIDANDNPIVTGVERQRDIVLIET